VPVVLVVALTLLHQVRTQRVPVVVLVAMQRRYLPHLYWLEASR
jgi:hypothetical protein